MGRSRYKAPLPVLVVQVEAALALAGFYPELADPLRPAGLDWPAMLADAKARIDAAVPHLVASRTHVLLLERLTTAREAWNAAALERFAELRWQLRTLSAPDAPLVQRLRATVPTKPQRRFTGLHRELLLVVRALAATPLDQLSRWDPALAPRCAAHLAAGDALVAEADRLATAGAILSEQTTATRLAVRATLLALRDAWEAARRHLPHVAPWPTEVLDRYWASRTSGHPPDAGEHAPDASRHPPDASGRSPDASGHSADASEHHHDASGQQPDAGGYDPDAGGHPPDASGDTPLSVGVAPLSAGVALVSVGVAPSLAGVTLVSAGVAMVSAGVAPPSADVAPPSAGVGPVSALEDRS